MIEYKEDELFVILTDRPVNITTVIAALLIFDITLFFLDRLDLFTAFIFAIPLFIAYLFLKKTKTTIVKESLDVTIESQYFFKTSVYEFNLKDAKVEIAFVSKLFKGNGVILINDTHPINTPDISFPKTKDLTTTINKINFLRNNNKDVNV